MADKRDARLTLHFLIVDGVVHFEVDHGDGTNCEALAGVFTQDGEVLALGHKKEYSKTRAVAVSRRKS